MVTADRADNGGRFRSSSTTSAASRSRTPSTPRSSSSTTATSSPERRQDRQRRGAARHRLQVRRGHPVARAVDPQRHRPPRGRHARRGARGPGPHQRGQGRPPHPLQEAGPVRAGLGHDRGAQGEGGDRLGPRHRGRQGRPDPRHRAARLPARVAGRPPPRARPAPVRPDARVQDHRARQEPQQRRCSRRAYLEETQREQRDEFLTNLKPGEIRSPASSRRS